MLYQIVMKAFTNATNGMRALIAKDIEYIDCHRDGFTYRIHKDVCDYRRYYNYPGCELCPIYLRNRQGVIEGNV